MESTWTATARLRLPDLEDYLEAAVEAYSQWAVTEPCSDCPRCLNVSFAVAAEEVGEARRGALDWLAGEVGLRLDDLVLAPL